MTSLRSEVQVLHRPPLPQQIVHYIYVLISQRNGRYYTGFAADPKRRLGDHNEGKVRATRYLRRWKLAYTEALPDAAAARKREYEIKSKKSRAYIESLIHGSIDSGTSSGAAPPEQSDLPDASGRSNQLSLIAHAPIFYDSA